MDTRKAQSTTLSCWCCAVARTGWSTRWTYALRTASWRSAGRSGRYAVILSELMMYINMRTEKDEPQMPLSHGPDEKPRGVDRQPEPEGPVQHCKDREQRRRVQDVAGSEWRSAAAYSVWRVAGRAHERLSSDDGTYGTSHASAFVASPSRYALRSHYGDGVIRRPQVRAHFPLGSSVPTGPPNAL